MPTFRLLHASDLHLAVMPYQIGLPDSWRDVVRRRRSPKEVSSHDPDVVTALELFVADPPDEDGYDVLVLSGDLATTGTMDDLNEARRVVTGLASLGPPDSAGHAPEVVIIPGNHDRFGPPPPAPRYMPFNRPGNANFDAVFGRYWTAGPGGVQQIWSRDKDGVRLVLIGADFSLSATDSGNWFPFGWCGQGRAYRPRVRALQQATKHARGQHSACVVIWVVHFPPFAAWPWLQLLDADVLLAAAADDRIPAVLLGHTHRVSRCSSGPGVPASVAFLLCGTTTQHYAPAGNYLNLVDISVPAPGATAHIALRTFRFDALRGFI